MAKSKKQKRYQRHLGVKKYNAILSVLVSDKKKSGEKYDLRELQRQASSLYPNFKDQPFKSITKTKIRTSAPAHLLPGQRHYVKLDIPESDPLTKWLTEPCHYWQLEDFCRDIPTFRKDPKIKFISKISPAGVPPFYSGDIMVSYEEYFQAFVRHCNQLKYIDEDEDAYTSEWFVTFTSPIEEKDGVLVCYIISSDPEGRPVDYGFDPENPDMDADEILSPTSKKEPKEKKEEKPSGTSSKEIDLQLKQASIREKELELELEKSKERQKQLDLEIKKQEDLRFAMELLQQGKISHDTFDKMISRIG